MTGTSTQGRRIHGSCHRQCKSCGHQSPDSSLALRASSHVRNQNDGGRGLYLCVSGCCNFLNKQSTQKNQLGPSRYTLSLLPPSQNICRFRFPRNNFNKIYIKKYYYLWHIISIIGKIFESNFLINLFKDTNVVRIFYKSSHTCGTHANDDRYLGTREYVINIIR